MGGLRLLPTAEERVDGEEIDLRELRGVLRRDLWIPWSVEVLRCDLLPLSRVRNPFASFSHTYAAKYAGLGTVGLSRNLLVPGWGPRIRLGSIFTAAALPGDPVLTVNLCTPCGVCEETCPAGAIREKRGQILGHLDKDACTAHHVALKQEGRWPCGICVKACPIGADRVLFEARGAKRHLEERPALHANPTDARYRHLVHLRTHGSGGIRIL